MKQVRHSVISHDVPAAASIDLRNYHLLIAHLFQRLVSQKKMNDLISVPG